MFTEVVPVEIIWIIVRMAMLLGGAVIAMIIIKRLLRRRDSSELSRSAGFTLEDLEQMRREDKISEEEYNLLREKILQDI